MTSPLPAPADADRSLLVGFLAWQMGFLDRDALLQALRAWRADDATPLEQVLTDLGHLTPERCQVLEDVVRKHQTAAGNNAPPDLAAADTLAPVPGGLPSLGEGDVEGFLSVIDPARTIVPVDTPGHMPVPGSGRVGGLRYRIVRPHAKGGLGAVSVALDQELHREVALKEIQEAFADDPDSRGRFLLEAEVTGRLEHPGIVPVYGLGLYADGRPFYAMRFIKGDSLQKAIQRFHAADSSGRDPSERSLALRQLLGRFVAVCNTIAYAHSRGILHRDLKPANVMLGTFGETLVVDWGLAKPVGQAEPAPAAGEPALRPLSGSSATATQQGAVLGTPAYMSPEQAAGQLDRLGPASDIYSLGATLYTLLTDRNPVEGADTWEVLRKVQRGEVMPPALAKPGTPPALAAVCLKALALRPEDRYPTALELAADLEHWLADEPVSAWREPPAVRLRRWVKRHRATVTAAVAAACVGVVSLAAATALLSTAWDSERQARELAERNEREVATQRDHVRRQRDQAQENFRLARDAVDEMLTEVGHQRLKDIREMDPVRQALLEKALTFYQKFLHDRGDDPEVRQETGRAYRRVGTINQQLGRHADAEAAYLRALELQEQLAGKHTDRPEYRQDLALSHNNLGVLYRALGRPEQAEAAYRKAAAVQEELVRDYPGIPTYEQDRAGSYNNLGVHYAATGRPGPAEEAFRQALAIRERLARDHPAVREYQQDLASSHNNLGVLYGATDRPGPAESAFQEALTVRERLARNHPTVTDYQTQLSGSYNNLGNLYRDTNRFKEAEAAFQQALALREQLARSHPAVVAYQQDVAAGHNNLGLVYRATSRPEQAEAAFRQALTLREQVAREHPTVPEYQQELASGYTNLGNFYTAAGRAAPAEEAYRKALAVHERLVSDHPAVPEYRQELASSHDTLGVLYSASGRPDQAEGAYRASLALREQLAGDHPAVLEFAVGLGGSYGNMGHLMREKGQPEAALAWYARSLSTLEAVLRQEGGHATARRYLGYTYWGRAQALGLLGRHIEAIQDWDRALEFEPGPQRDTYRLARARARALTGWHVQAAAAADEVVNPPTATGSMLYDAACVHALSAAAARKDAQLAPTEQDRLAERYAGRAVELLDRAKAAGFFKHPARLEQLKKDPDLDALRSHEGFRKLRTGLEAEIGTGSKAGPDGP
jgi:serine/threonine-protein kinase